LVRRLTVTAIPGIPLVNPGDDIAALIVGALKAEGQALADGDVLVIAQKIISKSEDRYVDLASVTPSDEARELAAKTDKDPRVVELILSESKEVITHRIGAIIVEHRLGYVHANAGIDASNIEGDERVLLLPEDSDRSAAELRAVLQDRYGVDVKIIINDSAGRAWRNGITGFTIGCAGFEPVSNMIGQRDLYGRPLEITEIAIADELACAGSYLMGQAAEGVPVVLIRGAGLPTAEGNAADLIRPKEQDLFR
jgi:coenzyme F420-0:L-glutamate ligase/coenzyme F420-1:gamma-L-glutamate ligase